MPEYTSDNNPEPKAPKAHHNSTSSNSQSMSETEGQLKKKTNSPRLQHHHLVSVRKYARSDTLTKVFHEIQQQLVGVPALLWQQQMEKASNITYNNSHLFLKPIPTWEPDYTINFTTRLKPISLMDDY